MTDEHRLEVTLDDDDSIVIASYGVNAELHCTEGVITLRKYPTGITLETVDCPRRPASDRLQSCLANGCRLLNDTIPVKEKRHG